MKRSAVFPCIAVILVLVWCFALFSVSAVAAAGMTEEPQAVTEKQTVSVTVSSASVVAGDPVTISGAVTGGNPVDRVMIWLFAGSYLDVSMAPVNPDGTYTKTCPTEGFPPATGYVFVQSPGDDGEFRIGFDATGRYAGQVVDAQDGSLLVSFTGAGSVQDEAAAGALTEALNRQDSDDVYTKTTFQLTAPSEQGPAGPAVPPSPAAPATKTPLSLPCGILGIGAGACCAAAACRKQ